MRRRRWPGRDRGSFTAEMAAGLPALMMLLLAGLTAVVAVTTRERCLAAARDGALAAARGESGGDAAARTAPEGALVVLDAAADHVTVTVRAPVQIFGGTLPVIEVQASAVAAPEPGLPGSPP